MPRRHCLAAGQAQSDCLKKFRERADLLGRGRLVDAIDEQYLALFETFSGRDIRLDHEFLDKLMGIEPLRRHDPLDEPVGIEDELALREIELERATPCAALS